jgi:aspartate/methionine/tyrosine aminotransferase
MNIKPFAVEEWMNEYEVGALYNIAETCVDSVSLDELFELTGENKEDFLKDFCAQRLTYGDIWGSEALRSGISKLYHTIKADEVVLTHGAAGANHHVFCSLISAGDRVVSIMPTYQQLYSIPEAIGADVAIMYLKQENDYLPDLNELKSLVTPETKMICINNPNNPTGATYTVDQLKEWVRWAKANNALILFDAAYECFVSEPGLARSIYEVEGAKDCAVEVCSFSKIAGFTGTRCGYTVVPQAIVSDGQSLNKMWLRRQTTKFNGVPYVVQRAAAAVFTSIAVFSWASLPLERFPLFTSITCMASVCSIIK